MAAVITFLLAGMLLQTAGTAVNVPPPDNQIAAAVLAAPLERRSAAAVLGYDARGMIVTLRQGSNDLVCLADDPRDKAFSVACYHKDLEPFMARGRELVSQGVTGQQREELRWKEIERASWRCRANHAACACSPALASTRLPVRSPTRTRGGSSMRRSLRRNRPGSPRCRYQEVHGLCFPASRAPTS